MSGSNDGAGSSWTSRFLKVASAAAATAAVAGGIYAVLSSSSANPEHEAAFGARRESEERYHGDPRSVEQLYNKGSATMGEKWEKPEDGCLKLNVDGSREHFNGPSTGCGGVVRDSSGKWVRGFGQKLDSSFEVHQTELQAILTGLHFVSNMEFKKLVVESDHESMVYKVNNGVKSNDDDYEMVKEIRAMLRRFDGKVKVDLIKTKANRVAHTLANNARTGPSYQEFPNPPSNCLLFLQKDETGYVSNF